MFRPQCSVYNVLESILFLPDTANFRIGYILKLIIAVPNRSELFHLSNLLTNWLGSIRLLRLLVRNSGTFKHINIIIVP